MRKLLALAAVGIIVIISLFIHGFLKIILKSSDIGLNLYNDYGTFGSMIYALMELSPLIIGIWLIKLSWKKITSNKNSEILNKKEEN